MKKLISIFCVIAMLCSFAVTVNAAGTTLTLDLVEQTATSAVYTLNLDTDTDIGTINVAYDMKSAIAAGIADADIKVATTTGNVTARYVAAQDLIICKRVDGNGSTITGKVLLCTITIDTTNMTGAFDFVQASGAANKNFQVVSSVSGEGAVDITSSVAFPTATVAMYAPAFTPETIKGAAVESSASSIELDKEPATAYKNVYENVAVFKATLGANVNYSEAGFIFVKEGKEANKPFVAAENVTAGAGTFEYGVVMVGVPADVTITAVPYYVTAE